jgi:hypothetical protein
MDSSRTSLPKAVKAVLDAIEKNTTLSVNALSRETGLNRRTVEKALDLLLESQTFFDRARLQVLKMDHLKMVEISEKSGLLELPENIQRLIIRTAYYPNPSIEESILVHMCLRGATSRENAILLDEDETLQKLVKQGQILKVETLPRFYLSDEGKIVADGALRLYPELKEMSARANPNLIL